MNSIEGKMRNMQMQFIKDHLMCHDIAFNKIIVDSYNKKYSKDTSCILIRFEEGTEMDTKVISKFGEIEWTMPFIPVFGVAINIKDKERFINEVQRLKGFVKTKEVNKFHEYSFMDI